MITIIAGDRECKDLKLVEEAVKASGFTITKVISGGAQGGDKLGEDWAKANNIEFERKEADWNDLTVEGAVIKTNKWKKKYNANAGFKRNSDMVEVAEAVIALQPEGPTPGTQDTIKKATAKGIPVFIWPSDEKRTYKYYFQP